MVSNIFFFHSYLGRRSNLTNIFQMGWFNHQLSPFIFRPFIGAPCPSIYTRLGLDRPTFCHCFFFGAGKHLWIGKKSENREGSSFLEVENQTEMGTVNHCKVFSVQALGGCKLDAKTRLFRQGVRYITHL